MSTYLTFLTYAEDVRRSMVPHPDDRAGAAREGHEDGGAEAGRDGRVSNVRLGFAQAGTSDAPKRRWPPAVRRHLAKLGGVADVGIIHRRYGRHALPDELEGAGRALGEGPQARQASR